MECIGGRFCGLAANLEAPAAGQCQIMQMQGAGHVVFRILLQGVHQADTGFQSPLEMCPGPKDDAGPEAGIEPAAFLLTVQRVIRAGIKGIYAGNCDIGNSRTQSKYNFVVVKMISYDAEDICHPHPVVHAAFRPQIEHLPHLSPEPHAGHYRPVLMQPNVQTIRKSDHGPGILLLGRIPALQKQPATKHDIMLNSFILVILSQAKDVATQDR